jgi:cell division protein FtsB
MSEYIHQDDAYEWVVNKQIQFAEDDFAKVQAERDELKVEVADLQKKLEYVRSMLNQLEKDYARGL